MKKLYCMLVAGTLAVSALAMARADTPTSPNAPIETYRIGITFPYGEGMQHLHWNGRLFADLASCEAFVKANGKEVDGQTDPEWVKALEWLLEHDINPATLTFECEPSE